MASANNTGNPDQIIAQADDDEANESTTFRSTSVSPAAQSASTMAKDPQKKKEKHATETFSAFNQHMTTAAHACVLLFVILIIYFCFSGDFQFFTWHPLLLSVGWMFLMTEAVLSISKENLFTGTLPKKVKVRLHWIFLTLALVLILVGFTVVFINKNNLGKQHFKTWHAFLGFIAIICSIPTCLDGILALYHGDLRHYISPRINKLIHIASGVTTVTFGGLTLILSVYTNWFAKNSNNNIIAFVLGVALASYPVVWTLIRPVTTCLKQVKSLIKVE